MSLTWTFEPGVITALLVTAAAYVVGVTRLWRAAGTGHGVRGREALAFVGASLALVVALVSPLDALSDTLFSAHMIQHELLILVAAPLAAVSAPLVALLWILPLGGRRAVARAAGAGPIAAAWAILTAPATAWLLHAAALWAWHLPALFDAALASDRVHALQHLAFFGTAVLFWWGILHGRYGRAGYGAGFVYVFTTALHSGVLGALLTVSPRPWYPAYASAGAAWGLTPLQDQQLAGLIMWVPASVIFLAVGLALLASWIRESERRVRSVGVARG